MKLRKNHIFLLMSVVAASVLAGAAFAAETKWNAAVSNKWSETTMWSDGLPASDSVAVLPPYDKDYMVTFDSLTDNVIGGLKISDTSGTKDPALATVTTTVLRVEKPLTINPSSRINVYRYGQIVIPEGGKLTIDPTSSISADSSAIMFNYRGSLLHVDGGTFEMQNRGYIYVCNGWSDYINSQPPEVRVSSGTFRIVHTNTADTGRLYYCYGYNKLKISGGQFVLVGLNNDVNGYTQQSDIESLYLSGSALFSMTNCSFLLGRGKAVFSDSSRFHMKSGRFYLGNTDMDGRGGTLTLKDNSSLDLYDCQFMQVGSGANGSGATPRGGTTTINYNGGNHTNALWNVWGCGKGETVVNVTGGISHINRFGLVVAAPWFYASSSSGNSTTGTVSVSGGVLSVTADHNKWGEALGRLTGFIIGCGTTTASSGQHYDGRLNVSGAGIVTNGAPFVVGVGPAVGTVTQTGGEIYSYATFAEAANGANPVAIGMCGAKGTYSVSAGKSTFAAPVWVGGMSTNHLHRKGFNIPAGSNLSRTSTGKLAVSGGSFHAKSNMYVGCDGTGTIEMTGGTLQIDGNLVLSNAVKSVLSVTMADGDSSPVVTVGGKFSVTDGAEISVDGTAIDEGSCAPRVFLTCASADGIDLSSISVTGRGYVKRRAASGGGVAFSYSILNGTMLLFR